MSPKQTVGIIDYGNAGNLYSIKKAIENLGNGSAVKIIKSTPDFESIDKIILPGVGAYADSMKGIALFKEGLFRSIAKKPTLGICLGMQILSEKGYEFGETAGLGHLEGEVMKIPVKCKVPHLGWASLDIMKPSRILRGISREDVFYFMHSYELINYKDVVALSCYGGHNFVSVIEKDNIFGVQFHPEKSRASGLAIFKNFLDA